MSLTKVKASGKQEKSIPLFDFKLLGFQFKDQELKKGQYRFPFAFKLPSNIPGSFKYQNKKGERI